MQIETAFQWPVTIYYEDTDIGGLVYHANYLKYFERARTEFLRSLGITQKILLAEQTAFVVRHMKIDFLQGATLDDHLVVNSHISELRTASMTFSQLLVANSGAVICKADVKIACINTQQMKPIAIPPFIKSEILRER
ncbi:MAG: tol-pal system-associated acyl-CoA thioesterase [Vibrionaceae bacterium]